MSGEYLIWVMMIGSVVGLAVSNTENEKWVRLATGAAICASLLTSILNTVGTLTVPEMLGEGAEYGDEIAEETLSSALADGIALDLSERFSLKKSEIIVTVKGFTYGSAAAEEVTVRLTGGAKYSDVIGIRDYVGKNYGRCEVITALE